jgi:hypothetical protein
MKEINELEVVSAIYFFDEDCCTDKRNYFNKIMQDTGKYKFNFSKSSFTDTRSHCFYLFPLKEYILPIIQKRKELKSDLKVAYDPEKKGMEVLLKYNINTLWGLIASVYFPINNVMVAEQVTSNIRLYVYMMSRVLNCFQTITDGGAYCLNEVCYFKEFQSFRKPGLYDFFIFQKMKKLEINCSNTFQRS